MLHASTFGAIATEERDLLLSGLEGAARAFLVPYALKCLDEGRDGLIQGSAARPISVRRIDWPPLDCGYISRKGNAVIIRIFAAFDGMALLAEAREPGALFDALSFGFRQSQK